MKIASLAVALAVIGVSGIGCTSSAPSKDQAAATAPRSASELEPTGVPTKPDQTSLEATPEMRLDPDGGKSAGPMQAESSATDRARLDKLQHEYEDAKAALAKSPNDAKAKERFTSIGALYGHESMMSSVLDRKVKYKQALHIYSEVLKVDPNNPVAKDESDMIVKIYKSMGRPIPKD